MERLSRVDGEKADRPATDWTSLPLQELVDHIESTHHAFLHRAIPTLSGLVAKVVQVHGERHPTLMQLQSAVSELFSDLQSHLMKEEKVLFPMIRSMNGEAPAGEFSCSGFQGPVSVMRYEHDVAKQLLEKIHRLTDNYKMPSDGCETYRQMLDGLKEFELDLHTHIHKENEVLFPGIQDLD
jgi:regulator of cell morphogenesis and NO signaling